MALIKELNGITPQYGKNCYFSETATIIGDVVMGDDCSVWFGAVLRGDVNPIRIGNRVNIQDGAVLHTLYKKSVVEIGDDVSLGHNVVIHGARLEPHCLIGIGSVVLDHAVVGENAIIAAGSVVLQNTIVEPGYIYAGVPAKKIKPVDPEQTEEMIKGIATNYLTYASWYKE